MKTPKLSFPRLRSLLLQLLLLALPCAAFAGAAPPTVIKVGTAKSAISMFVGPDGRLYQIAYGRADAAVSATNRPLRETEFYPQGGDGYLLEPALQAVHVDGNTSTALKYVRHETTAADDNVALTRIELKDSAYPFFVTLFFKTYRNEDVIEQWSEIRHDEDGVVTLHRFASSTPTLGTQEYWLTQFYGDYKREATLSEEKLTPGMKVLDSKIGVRANRFRTPSFILAAGGPAKEESGEAYGGSLKWSGSFQFAFDVDHRNRLRALAGINPFGELYRLKRGQVFATPGMLWTWSDQGKGQVSRNFHNWARKYGIRDGAKPRPVLLNNWEATEMRFDENVIVSLFDGAKEIGADTFLLDDGWFGNRHPRNNDRTGLGDWQVNTNKLPRGLSYLAEEANKRGIKFGIWIEPEMVNPASDLYEKHPEWAIHQPHRELEYYRNQLALDLSRPEVREFSWKVVDDTLGHPGIAYVKWDANRHITQPGSTYLPPEEQTHLLIDYQFALYDIMGRMAQKYPNVMAMVCAGGGGRVDYGSMQYFHSFWPSDNTDPRSRVFIQWGFSHLFPAPAISAHVTRMGNRPLKFAIDVAMSGAYGVDMDVRRVSAEDRKAIASASALYRERLQNVVLQGDLYRLESPYERPRAALNYVSADKSRSALFVYQLKEAGAEAVKPRGLDAERRYRVRELNLPAGATSQLAQQDQVVDGRTLMAEGLVPSCRREFESAVIELVAE